MTEVRPSLPRRNREGADRRAFPGHPATGESDYAPVPRLTAAEGSGLPRRDSSLAHIRRHPGNLQGEQGGQPESGKDETRFGGTAPTPPATEAPTDSASSPFSRATRDRMAHVRVVDAGGRHRRETLAHHDAALGARGQWAREVRGSEVPTGVHGGRHRQGSAVDVSLKTPADRLEAQGLRDRIQGRQNKAIAHSLHPGAAHPEDQTDGERRSHLSDPDRTLPHDLPRRERPAGATEQRPRTAPLDERERATIAAALAAEQAKKGENATVGALPRRETSGNTTLAAPLPTTLEGDKIDSITAALARMKGEIPADSVVQEEPTITPTRQETTPQNGGRLRARLSRLPGVFGRPWRNEGKHAPRHSSGK